MMNDSTTLQTLIQVYDPAMCCSTGVCGSDVDEALVNFAADVKWLKSQGIDIQRFNLGQEPLAFKEQPEVLSRLKNDGASILPLIVVNGKIVAEGRYPSRDEMSALALPQQAEITQPGNEAPNLSKLLEDIEAAVAHGTEADLVIAFEAGESAGLTSQDMANAMQAGLNKAQRRISVIVNTANQLLGAGNSSGSCCTPGGGCC
ncbi:MAG: arsenite efflux transporter metallochaperone ArsD [Candidatus Cyclonatronum sp.]|uniref:arsenite efflux transporter metallochaperone ArsD n=1 Tax=Cyclonatronum sp. TaxID=3024185 RepID=UPI0025BB3E00|nr:arsenite efflux transporter metallochaperone ArsD [Cyclonatronum sp.]MCH8485338.1 arsenite efflux transporter metallochaperone ArsD [Cyclonatronum sp.]